MSSKLKFNIEVIININYSELSDFITNYYGHDFEVNADLESANDTSHSFNIKKEPLSKYCQESLDKFKSTGEGCWITRVLLQDLVNNNEIPEGKIVVNVLGNF